MNDLELVQRACAGEDQAIVALVDVCLPEVLQWCTRLGGPRVDPEDAAQDVMVVVLRRLHIVKRPHRFRSWLFGITRRVLAAHRRRAWVRRWVPGAGFDGRGSGLGPERRARLSENSRLVQLALEELPAAQREVVVLFDAEERTAAEIAALLDLPVGTVKSRLRLGRARLAAALAGLGVDQDDSVTDPGLALVPLGSAEPRE